MLIQNQKPDSFLPKTHLLQRTPFTSCLPLPIKAPLLNDQFIRSSATLRFGMAGFNQEQQLSLFIYGLEGALKKAEQNIQALYAKRPVYPQSASHILGKNLEEIASQLMSKEPARQKILSLATITTQGFPVPKKEKVWERQRKGLLALAQEIPTHSLIGGLKSVFSTLTAALDHEPLETTRKDNIDKAQEQARRFQSLELLYCLLLVKEALDSSGTVKKTQDKRKEETIMCALADIDSARYYTPSNEVARFLAKALLPKDKWNEESLISMAEKSSFATDGSFAGKLPKVLTALGLNEKILPKLNIWAKKTSQNPRQKTRKKE